MIDYILIHRIKKFQFKTQVLNNRANKIIENYQKLNYRDHERNPVNYISDHYAIAVESK